MTFVILLCSVMFVQSKQTEKTYQILQPCLRNIISGVDFTMAGCWYRGVRDFILLGKGRRCRLQNPVVCVQLSTPHLIRT